MANKYLVLLPLVDNETRQDYNPGAVITLDDERAEILLEMGAIVEAPNVEE